jgi:hypothetical protein
MKQSTLLVIAYWLKTSNNPISERIVTDGSKLTASETWLVKSAYRPSPQAVVRLDRWIQRSTQH